MRSVPHKITYRANIVDGATALRRFLCVVNVPCQLRSTASTVIQLTGRDVGDDRARRATIAADDRTAAVLRAAAGER